MKATATSVSGSALRRPNGYLCAASVLCYFDPNGIQPAKTAAFEAKPEGFRELIASSTITYDKEKKPQWTLKSDVRRQVFAELKSPRVFSELIEANPDRPKTTLQSVLETYLRGGSPSLSTQSFEELGSILQVTEWLTDVLPNIPRVEDIQPLMERASMLQGFGELADQHFQGRKKELERLRKYVETSAASAFLDSLTLHAFSLQEKPPLLIHGPGGMGKSSLIARFVLEHVRFGQPTQLPLLYFDFDRPGLLASEPLTIVADGLGQLGTQFPQNRSSFVSLQDEVLKAISSAVRAADPVRSSAKDQVVQTWRVNERIRQSLLNEFSRSLFSLNGAESPVVMVLDTFEQVQLRSREYVRSLWEFLNGLQERIPYLRIVLSGRAPVDEFKTEKCPLKPLDGKSARAVLESRGYPVDVAKAVVAQVGGNPLSLWLAARILEKEGASSKGIVGWEPRRLTEELIQGILYRRILQHVANKNARKLAHPGLVLRRITPKIIMHVLARPCGVVAEDIHQAEELFQALRSDMTLVRQDKDGSLRHQPYLRTIMARLLREDMPDKVKEIEQLAIKFYERIDEDPISRAEEIFHRLSLGELPDKVRARWLPGVEKYLTTEIEELPANAQAFLRARMRSDLSEELEEVAEQADLEQAAANRVRDLIELNELPKALDAIQDQNPRRPGSELWLLEARVLMLLRRFEEARGILQAKPEVDLTPEHGILEVALLNAELDSRLGSVDSAEQIRESFQSLVDRFPFDIRVVECGVLRMEALQSSSYPSEGSTTGTRKLEPTLAKLLLNVVSKNWEVLKIQPDLSRRVVAVLGKDYPREVLDLLRAVGIGPELASWMIRPLSEFMVDWDEMISPNVGIGNCILAQAASVSQSAESTVDSWANAFESRGRSETTKLVDFLLSRFDLPIELVPRLASMIKESTRLSRERGIQMA